MNQDVKQVVNRFLEEIHNNKTHRYMSWEICHNTFLKYKEKLLTESDIDYLALHLGFYLASWGMYRGSSFLLQSYDYTIHKEAVIIAMQYKALFDINPFTEKEKYLNLLFDTNNGLYIKLNTYYKEKRNQVKSTDANISMVLITKILMGIFGCIPAYDRFFIDGISLDNISKTQNSMPNLSKLIDHINNDKNLLNSIYDTLNNIEENRNYTIMKIVDMYYWQLGKEKND